MTRFLSWVLGRLPIGWLQLSHSRARLIVAVAGVVFANVLVFVQLGIMGALNASAVAPYDLFKADIMITASDAKTLTDGSNVSRARMFQALSIPGVKAAAPIYIGNVEWQRPDGGSSTVQAIGLDPSQPEFARKDLQSSMQTLQLADTVLFDALTRGIAPGLLDTATPAAPYQVELTGRTINIVGTMEVGAGFSADGTLYTSDQTFLRLFNNRSSGAPTHILVNVEDGLDHNVVVERLRHVLPADAVKVATTEDAIAADLRYQTTERPTGIIFGFGVIIGIIVGIVIVYQVLSTDVADHLSEYATFKAVGYPQGFFVSIVIEQAIILAVLGFLPGLAIGTSIYVVLGAATGLQMTMTFSLALSVLIGTIAACALSGVIATRRLAAADPADLF
ncbi:ABC transporter permease DevC [Pseudaestuariivita rosea]|uniref:ABC transporter permease DevC n=1 Tax=Pseudaestuariivita rosea TaxID=2763263 RepID=UPI001ABBA77E|nr:ABC transporter permease DevC [Pseudaestuariivita rosea]